MGIFNGRYAVLDVDSFPDRLLNLKCSTLTIGFLSTSHLLFLKIPFLSLNIKFSYQRIGFLAIIKIGTKLNMIITDRYTNKLDKA